MVNRTCTCLQYQQLKYPCSHAAAAIFFYQKNIYDFVDFDYTVDNLKDLYSVAVDPIVAKDLIPQHLLPPLGRRPAGRPKILRFRSRTEGLDSNLRCSLCHELGHNKRTCARRSHPKY